MIGCGTSGHGFKFGPLLGGWLASLAPGGRRIPAERFGLGRFSRARLAAPCPGCAAGVPGGRPVSGVQRREHDDVAEVVAGRGVERAAAGDQPQLGVRDRPVHGREGNRAFRYDRTSVTRKTASEPSARRTYTLLPGCSWRR